MPLLSSTNEIEANHLQGESMWISLEMELVYVLLYINNEWKDLSRFQQYLQPDLEYYMKEREIEGGFRLLSFQISALN